MTKALASAIVALIFSTFPAYAKSRNIPLAAGTLIRCTVDEPDFSPKTARRGDPLVCYARPLREFGCSAFPAGTQLAGRLVAYHKPGRFFGKGWMKLQFDRLVLPIGETQIKARVVGVNGFRVDRKGRILGRGHPIRDAMGWAVPLLWPVKIVTLPMRGPEPALSGERVVTLRLLDDVTMPCEGYLGTVWAPYNTSGLVMPPSLELHLPKFQTLEKRASQTFSAWKATPIFDEPGQLSGVTTANPAAISNLFSPKPGPDDVAVSAGVR